MNNTSAKLLAIASWLENPDNDILLTAEDEGKLEQTIVAIAEMVEILNDTAKNLEEPSIENSLDDVVMMAEAFDSSDDPDLRKFASSLDELLMTIAAPKHALAESKSREELRIQSLVDKYNLPREELEKYNSVSATEKSVKKFQDSIQYRPLETSLSTRHCPDHPGVSITRKADDVYECLLDNKIYDFKRGFTTIKGNKVPGTCVGNQAEPLPPYRTTFSTRDSVTGNK